jgi:tetratricopeptide (TPR) repeat protein
MKNIFTHNKLLLLALVMLTASCRKDFLEITPKGKLIAQKTSDYNLLFNNLDLINMAAFGSPGLAQVPMGDEIAAVDQYFNGAALRTQRLFRWDDVIYEPDQDAEEMAVTMKNIYTYNKIIKEVMGSAEGTDQQKKSLQAEALAGRAWTYFLLINYYGKPYSSASSTDPGFPIVTEADVTTTAFTRSSVKDVYDFIVKDLNTAIPDLPPLTHRLRMSKAVAEALLGKVYVFMGKYNEALQQLNAAFNDLSSSSIPAVLYDYNVTLSTGGSFLPVGMFGPSYPAVMNNTENLYAKQFVNFWTFTNSEIIINTQTVALYGATDLRRKFYSATAFGSTTPYPNGMLRRLGPIATQFGMVLPDMYLLRAECKARLNDLTGAKADVEALRQKRMPAVDAEVPAAIATDQDSLVRFILDERIREFAVEGFRWFDMRRLSVDPQFSSTIGTTHYLYSNTTGAVLSTFTLKPERLVLRFPQKVINQNQGMQNNP